MVPLLHACLSENPRVCGFQHAAHSVREEREVGKLSEFQYSYCLPSRFSRGLKSITSVLRGMDNMFWWMSWLCQVCSALKVKQWLLQFPFQFQLVIKPVWLQTWWDELSVTLKIRLVTFNNFNTWHITMQHNILIGSHFYKCLFIVLWIFISQIISILL